MGVHGTRHAARHTLTRTRNGRIKREFIIRENYQMLIWAKWKNERNALQIRCTQFDGQHNFWVNECCGHIWDTLHTSESNLNYRGSLRAIFESNIMFRNGNYKCTLCRSSIRVYLICHLCHRVLCFYARPWRGESLRNNYACVLHRFGTNSELQCECQTRAKQEQVGLYTHTSLRSFGANCE